jgi:hypothetical protein
MALVTANSFVDMGAVVEVDKFREVMNALPFDWHIRAPAFAHRFEHLFFGVHLRVTVHTHPGRGYLGGSRPLHPDVTVSTIYAETSHMMFVGKLHRLFHVISLAGNISGPVPEIAASKDCGSEQKYGNYADLRLMVCVFMKYLRQGFCPAPIVNLLFVETVSTPLRRGNARQSLGNFSQALILLPTCYSSINQIPAAAWQHRLLPNRTI